LSIVFTLVNLEKTIEGINRAGRAFTDLGLTGGGTLAASSRAASFGVGLGMSTGQTGGLAASIRDAIAAGGFARSAASQLGVGNVLARGMGGPSDLAVFNIVAEGIRNATSAAEAYNLAMKLQAPELLRLRLLGDGQIRRIRALNEEIARIYGPEAQMRLARFQTEVSVLWVRLGLQLFRVFDAALKPFFGGKTDLRDAAAKLQESLDGVNRAVQANTVAIGQFRQVFGGGSNARGAVPAGLRGELLRKQMQAHAISLGAFGL